MFCFLACLLVLVREAPTRPTKGVGSTAPGDTKSLFQLVQPNIWGRNFNLSRWSCEDLRAKPFTYLSLKDQGLTSFPACLPKLLEDLELRANLLPEFNSQEVADLPMLQALSLRQNKIQRVTLDARSLSRLGFLDLSFNLLSVVPACNASTLQNLKWFSLAGNPIVEIQPLAFSCYPQLRFLNLSSTWLGKDGKEGIKESAFAMAFLPGDATGNAGSAIHVLDLSATYLERLHQDWIKDLPELSSLYLTNMSRLRSLDADIFPHLPELRQLDCQDSRALSLVETESFAYMPHMAVLIFQNCNLSSFGPWNLSSSGNLMINLYGNPLVCSCVTSWLFSKPDKIVLQRASETLCYPEATEATTSGPMLLSNFYAECQRQRLSNFTQVKLYGTSPSFTTDNLPDSSTFLQEWPSSPSHLTWRDTAKEAPTKADILAYKDKTFGRSTDVPPTTAALHTATSSRTLGELSSDLTLVSMTEMDQRKHETTAVGDSIGHMDKTWTHFAPLSPAAGETVADSSVLIPHNTVRPAQSTPPLQSPTKAVPLLTANSPKSYGDYYDYDKQEEEFIAQGFGPCDYDPCRHLQKPCFDLQLLSPCRCPGISDEFSIPDPPRLREISEITDTSAEVCWCAPYSAVRFYQLAYRPQDSKKNFTVSGEIYATARRYTLYNLLPGSTYQVCIIASNKAGLSQTADWNEPNAPCGSFKTKTSYKSIFAALCATSGFFLIATILLSVCLCKKCKGPHIEHYNTHLVSYKNPAFDYSLK